VALIAYFVGGHYIMVAALGIALFVLLTLAQIARRRRSKDNAAHIHELVR